jgi:catechol 2,3-dioxygenase-like lactoylglutathione lyase family enzyme
MRYRTAADDGRPGTASDPARIFGDMTIQRMDNVGIVVDDLDAAVAVFTELGMELEGGMPIEGSWAVNVVGFDDMRSEIAMMRIPDAPGRLELARYHTPKAITPPAGDHPGEHAGPAPRHVRRRRHRGHPRPPSPTRRRTRWRSDALRGQLLSLLSPRGQAESSSRWPSSAGEAPLLGVGFLANRSLQALCRVKMRER